MPADGANEVESTGPYGSKEKTEKRKPEDQDNTDLVVKVRKRKCIMFDADQDNRTAAMEDIKFLHEPGAQWDKAQKEIRGDRPCYEFNELRVKALRVINDMRANRPQGKVRAVEDGDVDTAETKEGLIRNLWTVSDGDSVIDYAADYQVSGGMGAWRVETEWSDDSTWRQNIRVRPFKNPFCVWRDPAATDPMGLDAEDWIVSERITKKSYETKWPDAAIVSMDDDQQFDDNDADWYGDEMVRICEYWWKKPVTKVIALLSDGKTIEIKEGKKGDTRTATMPDGAPLPVDPKTGAPLTIKRRRSVKSHKIMMCIVSGNAILEEPTEWAGKFFPFVQIFGEWRVIDGKVVWYGLARHSKDAQRMENVTMTAIAESVMSAPMSHFWATPKQAEGHVEKWKEAHKKLIPYLPYNPDPAANAGGPPQRMQPADVPLALMEMRNISADLLKGTSGIFDASIGAQSNETSGRAINARTRQGEVATFNYSDNMSKGVRQTWIIVDDLIGKIYTAEQSVRVLGVDGAEKYVKVNTFEQDPKTLEMKRVNDLGSGTYDVTMTVGPSFSTQRQEATELYSNLGQSVPAVWTVAGDLIFKSMDLPYADQIAERMRLLLPPPVQKMLQEGSNKKLDPAAMAVMAQAEQMMQQVQAMGAEVQKATSDAQKAKADAQGAQASADRATAEIDIKIANLKAAEAQLGQRVAEFQKNVVEQMMQAEAGNNTVVQQAIVEGLANLEQQAGELFAQYAEQLQATHAQGLASIAATQDQNAAAAPPPPAAASKKRRVVVQRQPDGSLSGEVVDQPNEVTA